MTEHFLSIYTLTDLVGHFNIVCDPQPHCGFCCLVCGVHIKEYIEKYINKCKSDGYNPDCIRGKVRHLHDFLLYKNIPIKEVTIEDIQNFINSLDKSETCKWTYKKDLKSFFRYCNLMGWCNIPIDIIRNKMTREKVIKFMSQEEFNLIIAQCDGKYKALFCLLYESGCRIGELLSLKVENVDNVSNPRKFYIVTEKTNEMGVCFYNTDISTYLSTRKGKKHLFDVGQNAVREKLKNLCDRAGIRRLSPHTMRHAFGKRAIESNLSLRLIQELLRHKDISSTQLYTHVLSSELEQAHNQMNEKEILKISSSVGNKSKYKINLRITKNR